MEMTILQAVLCGIVYWLAVGNLPFVGLWSLQRPLVCGAITGLILGHPVQGAVIGATINLVYLGCYVSWRKYAGRYGACRGIRYSICDRWWT